MKIFRILLATAGASSLLVLTPACEMKSAETMKATVHTHADEEHHEESATKPEPANPEPPKYFNQ